MLSAAMHPGTLDSSCHGDAFFPDQELTAEMNRQQKNGHSNDGSGNAKNRFDLSPRSPKNRSRGRFFSAREALP
jgi:hypothetical protein